MGDNSTLKIDESNVTEKFRFGNVDHQYMGSLNLHLPVKDDIFILFEANIVSIDHHFLLDWTFFENCSHFLISMMVL